MESRIQARPPTQDHTPSRIEQLCIERGLKMTGQRRLIARVLSEAEDHPDVEDVYRRALALDNKVSIATVYRTVRLLEEKGILERRDFGGGRARYSARTARAWISSHAVAAMRSAMSLIWSLFSPSTITRSMRCVPE